MKNINSNWLGTPPEHWKALKLRQILRPFSEKNHADLQLLSVVREKGVIVRDTENDDNHNYIPDDLSNYKMVKSGQFAMNKMKAWQGSYGVSKYTGIVSPAYFVFDFNYDMNPDYFHYAIRSRVYVSFFGQAWVLNGATVLYGSASELRVTLDYDFAEEKKFSYKNLSMEEIIHHLAFFVSRLWQIHVFGEGNTRTTAVFFIKYLRTLGFDATNDIFAENAWYFRNALVRANYNDLKNGVHETTEYLELFLRNLLLDEKNELHNRTMHISGRFAEVDIERVKVDIKSGEVDIESTKVDIRNKLLSFSDTISEKTINHTVEIFSKCGKENCFGRTIVEEITGLKPSRASKLIKLLVDSEVIVLVTGHGKGKYRFQ